MLSSSRTVGRSGLDSLLAVAELVHGKLSKGGELGRWLSERFEPLSADRDRSVIETLGLLAKLGVPLVTTNYDSLIESVTGLRHVTADDPSIVMKVVRGEDRRVLHLHGHWEKPESVVLGIRSYEAVKHHEHTQTVMKLFGVGTSLLFVGCGQEGLNDPNWGPFLNWLVDFDTAGQHEHRHYVLLRDSDPFEQRGRIFALRYGPDFADLAGFLKLLLPESRQHCADFFAAMLNVGVAERDPGLADQCLNEAMVFVPEPFLKVPRSKTKNVTSERRAAVLRLRRSRVEQAPRLIEICRQLEASEDSRMASFAKEIGSLSWGTFPTCYTAELSFEERKATIAERQPGSLWTDERTGITYVWIPAGQFVMGSDHAHRDDEKPSHWVTISKPFWLGRYPVTNAQYLMYLQVAKSGEHLPKWNDRRFNQPEQPVVGVSWHDAKAFAKWAQA